MSHHSDCAYCDIQERLTMHSPPSWLHNLSRIITPVQEIEIKDYIALLQTHIDAIDSVIIPLQQKRLDIERIQRRCENFFPTVLRMPPEVLAAIFQCCVDDWTRGSLNDYFDRHWDRPPRCTITQVCRYWRDVARETPELWRNIHIADYTGRSAGHLLLADDLALSKNLSLHLFLNFDRNRSIVLYSLLRSQLASTQHRWASFEAPKGLDDFFLIRSKTVFRPKYPLLRSVVGKVGSYHLGWGPDEPEEEFGRYVISAADAPLLAHVYLDLDRFEGELPDFPWSQLTYVELYGASRSYIEAIIIRSSNLKRLQITPTRSLSGMPVGTVVSQHVARPIFLPLLDTFEIDLSDTGQREERWGVLTSLHLPALKTLCCRALEDYNIGSIVSMLRETSISVFPHQGIQTLELKDLDLMARHVDYEFPAELPSQIDSETSPLYSLFQQLPSLKNLRIRNPLNAISGDGLLDLLAGGSGLESGMLSPSLERISIAGGFLGSQPLTRFVLARMEHGQSCGRSGLLHIELDEDNRLSVDHTDDDIKALTSALQAFVQRPGALLSINVRVRLSNAKRPQRLRCSRGSKMVLVSNDITDDIVAMI